MQSISDGRGLTDDDQIIRRREEVSKPPPDQLVIINDEDADGLPVVTGVAGSTIAAGGPLLMSCRHRGGRHDAQRDGSGWPAAASGASTKTNPVVDHVKS